MTEARDGALYRSLRSALAAIESGRLDNAERSLARARRDASTLDHLPTHSRRRRKARQAIKRVEVALASATTKGMDPGRHISLAQSELGRLLQESA